MSRSGRVATPSGRAVVCAWAMVVAIPAASHGQSSGRFIHGVVLDTRDQPVALVNVTVNGGRGATVSDDSGRFRLEIAHRERVVFDVRRLGYTPSRVALGPGGDTTVSVLLLPTSQQLAGVNVNDVAPKPITLAGFEERMLKRQR